MNLHKTVMILGSYLSVLALPASCADAGKGGDRRAYEESQELLDWLKQGADHKGLPLHGVSVRKISKPSDIDVVRSQYGEKQDGMLFCSLASSGSLSLAILEALQKWVSNCSKNRHYEVNSDNAKTEDGLPDVRPGEGASEPLLQLVRGDSKRAKKYHFGYASNTMEQLSMESHCIEESMTSTYIDLASETGKSIRVTLKKSQIGNSDPVCEFRQEGDLDFKEFVGDIAGAKDARTGYQFELMIFYMETDGCFWCQLVARR